jgi:D-alanyl-lipoteichoic acid acyltransferase DltB (MBOAT superfamily)
MSLTSWFRDYLFLPVSFAVSWKIKHERVFYIKTDLFIYIVASLITWFLTGLWHGANYTFIIWGMIHGGFLIFYQWQRKPRKKLLKTLGINNNNIILVLIETFITLAVVILAWVFFRSESLHKAVEYFKGIFSVSLFSFPQVFPKIAILISMICLLTEFVQRTKQHALQLDNIRYRAIRWGIYLGIVFIILFFGGGDHKFIYFQF